MTSLIIGLVILMAVIAIEFYHYKNKKNGTQPQNKKKSKLLRFQRGNKTLTPEQQKDLDRLNKQNFAILKQMWNDEHL